MNICSDVIQFVTHHMENKHIIIIIIILYVRLVRLARLARLVGLG